MADLGRAAGVAVALVLLFVPATPPEPAAPPVAVRPPVRGRWTALNSPATRTPSHGTHAYGQTYAIDLVHEPDPARPRVALTRWPLARRPRTFPGFGQPVLAPADGVVVRVSDWQRDHWSRTSWPAVLYLMLVEGLVREATGPGRVIGNHLVLDLGDGVYALLAHLRRRSALVSQGDRVRAGQPLAACGNSGNSVRAAPALPAHGPAGGAAGRRAAVHVPRRGAGHRTGTGGRLSRG